MRRVKVKLDELSFERLARWAVIGLFAAGMIAAPCLGQQKGQKTFASLEEAIKALYAAAQINDEKALMELFGTDGKEIVNSGDPAEDAESRATFVKRYEQMHRLVREPDGKITLYIGAHNWPCPIPIVSKGNVWYFETEMGKREILFRRIGLNEMSAIRVCEQLAEAQKEYRAQQNGVYAVKIFSDEGKRDGLYWKEEDNEPKSPIGPMVAWAVTDDDAKNRGGTAVPYRGYMFHMLTSQGKNAPGGAKSYMNDGKMTAGFAFVAYPAEYRSSGVKTFVISDEGVVYEKDLGNKTELKARSMKGYNPDSSWQKTEIEPQQAAEAVESKP